MKLCICGPGDIVPKPGHKCGRCDRYVTGPPKPRRKAFEIPQTRHDGERPRRARGVVGAFPAGEEELTGRAVQQQVRKRRRYTEDYELNRRRHRRTRTGGRSR